MLRNPLQAAYEQITRVQSDDPDVVRRGRLLNTLIPAVLLDLALTFVGIPLCLGAMWVSRRGDPARAAYLFLGILWTSLTAALLASATIEDAFTVVPFLFSLPVIVAGLTAGRVAPFVFA